jgi:hypothetical protein
MQTYKVNDLIVVYYKAKAMRYQDNGEILKKQKHKKQTACMRVVIATIFLSPHYGK